MMNWKVLRNVFQFILIHSTMILLGLVGTGEIALRLMGNKAVSMRPLHLQNKSVQYSPSVFAIHVFPTQVQDVVNSFLLTNEGNPHYYINKLGYRGRDFDIEKKPGTIRIMIYGGSSVFDLVVSENEDWPHKIEQFFHQDGMKNVEVINAGIPGHSSFDVVGRLFTEGHNFKPDYVIMYAAWNDVKRFSSDQFLLRELTPYEPTTNPLLYYENNVDQFLGDYSYLYSFLRYEFLNFKFKVGLEGASKIKDKIYKLNQRALDQFKLDMELFVDCARNMEAQPILMTEGTLLHQENLGKENFRLRHARGMLPLDFAVLALKEANNIIRQVAHEKNVPLIDAQQLLVETDTMYYADHVHLTHQGSEALALIVKKHLHEIMNISIQNVKDTLQTK